MRRRDFLAAGSVVALNVGSLGDVLAAISFLHGIAAEELDADALAHRDPRYEVIVAVRASAS